MQMNELVGQVQQGTRLPDMDRTSNDARTTRKTRAERRGTDGSRDTGTNLAGTTRVPVRYGAGF